MDTRFFNHLPLKNYSNSLVTKKRNDNALIIVFSPKKSKLRKISKKKLRKFYG
jgi:hypothetical protein